MCTCDPDQGKCGYHKRRAREEAEWVAEVTVALLAALQLEAV